MKLRFVPVLLLYPLLAILGAQPSAAGGCGWDYPCPPDPGYGRPAHRSGQVNIHNNYGSVNIYTSRRPGPPVSIDPGFNPGFDPDSCRGDGCRYGCGGYPCTEKCGTLCWLRRFRQGYCGHGCASYIEQARIEAEEKARWQEEEAWRRHKEEWMYRRRAECAPPSCVAEYDAPPPPPPPMRYYGGRPRDRDYAPPPPPPPMRYFDNRPRDRDYAPPPPSAYREPPRLDLTPRERFQGPQYPPK